MKFLTASSLLLAAAGAGQGAAAPIELWPTQTRAESDNRRSLLGERMANQRLSSVSHAHFFSTDRDIYSELNPGREISFGIPGFDGDMIEKRCFLQGGNPVVPAALQAKYADTLALMHCVTAEGEELNIVVDKTREDGLSAVFFGKDRKAFYVDSALRQSSQYIIYSAEVAAKEGIAPVFSEDFSLLEEPLEEPVEEFESGRRVLSSEEKRQLASDFPAFKFTLMPLANRQYSNFHGNTKESVLAQIIECFSRVNGVYAHEMGVFLVLHENADLGICLQGDDRSACSSLGNSGSVINSAMGVLEDLGVPSEEYDIGHVLTTGSGGLAALASLCSNRNKARGTTGLPEPFTDVYYIDYVAHEIGHQLNGGHVFRDCNGPNDGNLMQGSAVEPGSGSSIMGYAGICGKNNIASNSDPYFNNLNLQQMRDFVHSVGTQSGCGTQIDIDVSLPTVSAVDTCSVPVGNFFQLKGTSDTSDGDAFFSWDRVDTGIEDFDSETLGAFRSWKPTTSKSRFFPNLHALNFPRSDSFKLEKLPTRARDMTFRFMERRLYSTSAVAESHQVTQMGDYVFTDTQVEFVNAPALEITSPEDGVVLTREQLTVAWNGLSGNGLTVEVMMAHNILEDFDEATFDYERDVAELEWITVATSPMETGEVAITIPSELLGKSVNIMVKSSFEGDEGCFFFDLVTAAAVAQTVETDSDSSSSNSGKSAAQFAMGAMAVLAVGLVGVYAALKVKGVKAPPKPVEENSHYVTEADVKKPRGAEGTLNPTFEV